MGVACLPSDGCWRHGGGWDCCWGDSTEGDGPAKWWAKSINNEGNGHPGGGGASCSKLRGIQQQNTVGVYSWSCHLQKKQTPNIVSNVGPLFWINPLIDTSQVYTSYRKRISNLRIYLRMFPPPRINSHQQDYIVNARNSLYRLPFPRLHRG